MRVSQVKRKIEIEKLNRIGKINSNLMARGGGYYLRLNKNNRGYSISVGTFTHHGKNWRN